MGQAVKEAPSKAYTAVRDGMAGVMNLSARGRILVSGRDAEMFLNGLVTNDVKALGVNAWMPAAFASVQGRLLAAVRIIRRADGFLIDTEEATRERVFRLLERFSLAGDFKVADVTDQTALLSVQGKGAPDFVRVEFGRQVQEMERRAISQISEDFYIVPATHTAEEGFDLFMAEKESDYWWNRLIDDGIPPVDEKTQEILRIEAGIPRYGIDIDDTTIISETNLDDAISFTKGCYVGQEIVIRIKHRGHVAKKLTGIIFDYSESVEKTSKIVGNDDQEIGRITSTAYSPALAHAVALGYVKYDYLAAGTKVYIVSQDQRLAGTVADLPFVRGSWVEQNAP